MDNGPCRQQQKQRQRQHQNYHEGCTCYPKSLESCCCPMNRLAPYSSDQSCVPLSRDCVSPCGIPTTPVSAIFHPGGLGMGVVDNSLIQPYSRVIHSPCLQLDGLRYNTGSVLDPHASICMVPLPEHIGEPSFIRKRNERERERVKCVNDGYDRLKEHLPLADKDRRLSKVETLRGAIKYIRQLKRLLEHSEQDDGNREKGGRGGKSRNKLCLSARKRCSSVSSSEEAESSQSD